MITINNLSYAYGKNIVLDGITMNLKPGNIYGLLGENGVGKTTLLTLLCGLKKPLTGNIDIDGYRPYGRKPGFLSNIYYLSDDPADSSLQPMQYAAAYGQFWQGFDMKKFTELLALFEVPVNNSMDKMSTGELKKTHISFALACSCRYILMDEPTNGLDIPSKTQFRKALMHYTADESTLLISTHQVKDLENVIDPIIILDRREVLLNASVADITAKLFFDYGSNLQTEALYSEMMPGGSIQVLPNSEGRDSKLNLEALFNAVHKNKDWFRTNFGANQNQANL